MTDERLERMPGVELSGAVLVASPKLLDIRCRTVDQMRLANSLCALVELAR